MATLALRAGFRGQNAATAVAVANAENRSFDSDAINHNKDGSVDVGIWQINSSNANPDAMKDPQANANEAFRLASSGRGWANWTNYRNRLYLVFLPGAEAAVLAAQAAHPDLGLAVFGSTPIDKSTLVPGVNPSPQPPSIIGEMRAFVDALNRIGSWVSNSQNWGRVLYVGIGGVLLVVAIGALTRPVTEPIVKTAAKVAK